MVTKKQDHLEETGKKAYTSPRLTVYGSLEELTAQQNKSLGPTDGFLFMGQPIQNAS